MVKILKYICLISGASGVLLMFWGTILTGLLLGDYLYRVGSMLGALALTILGLFEWQREKKQALVDLVGAVAILSAGIAFSFFGPYRPWLFLVAVVLLAAFEVFRWFGKKRCL
jgi:hypothetical protein